MWRVAIEHEFIATFLHLKLIERINFAASQDERHIFMNDAKTCGLALFVGGQTFVSS